jgi:hypothetical protein
MVDEVGATPRHARKPPAAAKRSDERSGKPGLRRLPDLLDRLLAAPARQRGLADAALLADWPLIVGHELAGRCQPVRIARLGGEPVLHLRASGGAALELQHAALQVIERINAHFGFPAVARLRLIQAPAARPPRPRPTPSRPLSVAAAREIEAAVATTTDPALRAALAGLGHAIHRRPPDDGSSG